MHSECSGEIVLGVSEITLIYNSDRQSWEPLKGGGVPPSSFCSWVLSALEFIPQWIVFGWKTVEPNFQ